MAGRGTSVPHPGHDRPAPRVHLLRPERRVQRRQQQPDPQDACPRLRVHRGAPADRRSRYGSCRVRLPAEGHEIGNLIDAALTPSDDLRTWTLGSWDLITLQHGSWYEVAVVGVDDVGNVDPNPTSSRSTSTTRPSRPSSWRRQDAKQ
ncbi:MAG: hypothetical protein MZV65_28980 [Chromatiales bacterium]|nr:hypothetical protein [Chromatiales bacterium]